MKKARKAQTDPWLAVLDYRNTLTQGMKSSTVQRPRNQRTKTLLPIATSLLQPKVTKKYKTIKQTKDRQKKYYDQRARNLPELKENQTVRIQSLQKQRVTESNRNQTTVKQVLRSKNIIRQGRRSRCGWCGHGRTTFCSLA